MQVMIYVKDEGTLAKIKSEAKLRGESVSGYLVGLHLARVKGKYLEEPKPPKPKVVKGPEFRSYSKAQQLGKGG